MLITLRVTEEVALIFSLHSSRQEIEVITLGGAEGR
jgi:hypothetical protein